MSVWSGVSQLPKTLASGVLANIGMSLASRVASAGSNLFYVAVTAWLYSKEEVAVLAVGGIVTSVLDAAKGLGLGTCLLKRLPQLDRDSTESGDLIASYLLYSLAPAMLLGLGAWAVLAPLENFLFSASDRRPELVLALAVSVLTVLMNANLLVFQARQQFGLLALGTVVVSLLQRLAPCLAAQWRRSALLEFLWISLILSAAATIMTYAPLARLVRSRRRLLRPAAFWPEYRHFYYAGWVRYSATQIDQLLVAMLFSPSVLASYYVLRRLYSIAVMLIASMLDALVPDASRRSGEDRRAARQWLQDWLRVSLYGATIAAAFLAAVGPLAVGWILGPAYAEDPVLIALFAIASMTCVLFGVTQVDFLLFEDSHQTLRLTAFTAAVQIAAGVALSMFVGVRGMPLSMAVSFLLALVVAWRWAGASVLPATRLVAALGSIALAALAPLAGPAAAAICVGLLAWVQYHRWQVGSCWRRLA